MSEEVEPPEIRKLDDAVINRIAAGEIIHRPANALKELLENAIDAGSTKIEVTLKDGGLSLLQIQDNGKGIRKADFPIVCKRFTTSKIKSFDDLTGVQTFGFRGEALASISHISRLSITSCTAKSDLAYQASFVDGVLQGKAEASAGVKGTIITVEDMFFNMPLRRQGISNKSEEYKRCLKIVSRYAVHYPHISFTCRKGATVKPDLKTSVRTDNQDAIRTIFGGKTGSRLLELKAKNEEYGFKASGLVSPATESYKKQEFILFINHRLVHNNSIKRQFDGVYERLLKKGCKSFVYLALEIKGENIDVNVHPTKREVHFLHEDSIVEVLTQTLQKILENATHSRVFEMKKIVTQPLYAQPKGSNQKRKAKSALKLGEKVSVDFDKIGKKKGPVRNDSKLVRTNSDFQPGSLEKYFEFKEQGGGKRAFVPKAEPRKKRKLNEEEENQEECEDLESVHNLLIRIEKNKCENVSKIFEDYLFVGCVNTRRALFQQGTKLYLTDLYRLTRIFFYEMILKCFSRVKRFQLPSPLPIIDLVKMALKWPHAKFDENKHGTMEECAKQIDELLAEKAEMLDEYFGVRIKDGKLVALPHLLSNYPVPMLYLPMFILRCGTQVNWEEEQNCFHTFSMELARLFQIRPLEYYAKNQEITKLRHTQIVQHVVLPAIKREQFRAPKFMALDGSLVEVADLTKLYKVFERC